jgi:hypothetical protein
MPGVERQFVELLGFVGRAAFGLAAHSRAPA